MADQPSRSSRRAFLQGRAAVERLQESLKDVAGDQVPTPAGAGSSSYLLRYTRRAMACSFEIFAHAGQHPETEPLALEALDLVDALEEQLSVYRDSSELSALNRLAAERPVVVTRPLLELIVLGLRLHQETDGAFDLTLGPLSKAWGFFRRAGGIPDPPSLEAARDCVGSEHVVVCDQSETVTFARAGVELNFNSLGKGYALDRCHHLLQAGGLEDYLLHGGHSSVLASGSESPLDGTAATSGWSVGVPHPYRSGERLGTVRLRNQALATSGSGRQFFHHRGKRYGHILDPRSGQPADGILAATAIAVTAVEADALATAFFVMGPRAVREYCRGKPELGALLVTPGEREGSLSLHEIGLRRRGTEWECTP